MNINKITRFILIIIEFCALLHFAGCNLKDEHNYGYKKNGDSLKTANTLREINELWLKIDRQKNLLNSSIQSGNKDHLDAPIDEIISLSKTILYKHKEIQQEKKDRIKNIINKLKLSGEDIETYNKNKDEQMLIMELNNFNHLIEEMRATYNN